MSDFLQIFCWIPLAGFLCSLFFSTKNETWLSGIAIATSIIYLLVFIPFLIFWLPDTQLMLNRKHLTVFKTDDMELFIDFCFDKTTAVFSAMGGLITFLISLFSKFYLHRDPGYKRYFCTLLLFFLSYNILVFSGNFETFFAGWELLGICSFLLISFYRERYLPVRNSLKVISIYRLSDICLILAMWMSHHLWHENITFAQLQDPVSVASHISEHQGFAYFIIIMLIVAAAIKSAQVPFSSWLPRAMEGPTTSSAIFYGALSIHLGVFLLIRTQPYWGSLLWAKALIILIGISSSLIASGIGRVQASVKVQIAYASIAQIGLMFIEVALGLETLALIHFCGNAFLRTYQLLVSPSVLGYRIHDMVFTYQPTASSNLGGLRKKIHHTLYMLNLKEWNLDEYLTRFLWTPFKLLGKRMSMFTGRVAILIFSLVFLAGASCYMFQDHLPSVLFEFLPELSALIAFILILSAFADKGDAIHAWTSVVLAQFFMNLTVGFLNQRFGYTYMLIYLSGSVLAAITGYWCLRKMKKVDQDIQLNRFHGYGYEYPLTGFLFLMSSLGLLGLPFTPTFIGIDLLISHIHKSEIIIILLTAFSFLLMEIAILRIYARVFMGLHKKHSHAMAYRSS